MKTWLVLLLTINTALAADTNRLSPTAPLPKKVYILPIREQIMPPLVYLVRRGVKEAMEANADLLVIDMDTPGGRLDTCREIISILGQFKGDTVTYVNKDAFSAGSFVAVATKRIYMAPQSVIGAAAPMIMNPGGEGIAQIPDTVEKKMTSAVRAMVRATAEKNGYNVAVVEAMIDKDRGLNLTNVTDGVTNVVTIARVNEILTLTNTEAEKEYGKPPRKLLSSGTVASLDELLKELGYGNATVANIKPSGAETLGIWINAISPILLIIGILGLYIEYKSPGLVLPAIVGIAAFALYFFGGYVAGFSGLEWMLMFLLGLILVLLELFVFTGTLALGIVGALLMLLAIVMALVDVYPQTPVAAPPASLPLLPNWPALTVADFNRSLFVLCTGVAGSFLSIWVLRRFMPQTAIYRDLVSASASGMASVEGLEKRRSGLVGSVGVAVSSLRPGGKAQFGDELLDVITEGEMAAKGQAVRSIGFSAAEAIVQVVGEESGEMVRR
ncbi:MAG: ATP-dependent Clp protease proteolytic subunit [Verrucomicrobia bacterium]|nr:ATP-dependent Clp protease proteolytic subunit [Verrucomicrobiota bacterium]